MASNLMLSACDNCKNFHGDRSDGRMFCWGMQQLGCTQLHEKKEVCKLQDKIIKEVRKNV